VIESPTIATRFWSKRAHTTITAITARTTKNANAIPTRAGAFVG
jgi:hypothetical protein